MNSPITYRAEWLTEEFAESAFADMVRDIAWEHRDAPRKEAFFNDLGTSYTYGSGNGIRTYYPQKYVDVVYNIKSLLEAETKTVFEACFCNYYEGPRDHLGWHADDSEMIDTTRPIAVISLGSVREIWFRENGTKGVEAIQKLSLGVGSLLLMHPGMQQTHEHRIPKHGANCGARISLTFRGLK
jgi:alkylated DNA repair dioxygenase AlkB